MSHRPPRPSRRRMTLADPVEGLDLDELIAGKSLKEAVKQQFLGAARGRRFHQFEGTPAWLPCAGPPVRGNGIAGQVDHPTQGFMAAVLDHDCASVLQGQGRPRVRVPGPRDGGGSRWESGEAPFLISGGGRGQGHRSDLAAGQLLPDAMGERVDDERHKKPPQTSRSWPVMRAGSDNVEDLHVG